MEGERRQMEALWRNRTRRIDGFRQLVEWKGSSMETQAGSAVGPVDAWLSSGMFDYLQAPGRLALIDARIRFTVVAAPGPKNARWLEKVTGQPGLAERLLNGERVTVLDDSLDEVRTRWSLLSFGTYLRVRKDGTLYRIYFFDAGAAAGMRGGAVLGPFLRGRAASRPFREALAKREAADQIQAESVAAPAVRA